MIDKAQGDHYVGDISDKLVLEKFAEYVHEKYGLVSVLRQSRIYNRREYLHRWWNDKTDDISWRLGLEDGVEDFWDKLPCFAAVSFSLLERPLVTLTCESLSDKAETLRKRTLYSKTSLKTIDKKTW